MALALRGEGVEGAHERGQGAGKVAWGLGQNVAGDGANG